MDFKADKPIFRQIVDLCHSRILAGEWPPGARIPSIRELAVEYAVNNRTVLSAFEEMQREGIIAPRRGMGYFLADDAPAIVLDIKRTDFFDTTLRQLSHSMRELGITPVQVADFLASLPE